MNIPMIKVPTFKMTLPFTQKVINFRPYVVKEEKLLIMAMESDSIDSAITVVGDLVKSCTFGMLDVEKDPMFDVQYAFLQIRGKSQGESIDIIATCTKCKNNNTLSINVEDFKLQTTPAHSNKITLDENYHVTMKYPTFNDFADLYNEDKSELIYEVVARCIDSVYNDEEVFKNDGDSFSEFRTFVDNLTPEQFEKFENFFVTMPILQYASDYTCKGCGTNNYILIDGVSNFFE